MKKGAKKQRLLWASTSVKNSAYPDTLYVSPLVGPDTVSLMNHVVLLGGNFDPFIMVIPYL